MLIPNQWYAVLESDEVKDKPVAFKRLGEDLVFWRGSNGQVAAAEDRCAHRQVKLSLGKVVNNCIECPYHGFQFNPKGECELIPANGVNGPRPKIFQLKSYHLAEKHGFIWLWYGESREQYPEIPFFDELEGFEYATYRTTSAVGYTRAIENQLDVAHLPFVHESTIGRTVPKQVIVPYCELENDTLSVWNDFQGDENGVALRPNQMNRPNTPAMLMFKFPNIWTLRLAENFRPLLAFVPVDDETTFMYLRSYHKMVNMPVAREAFSRMSALSNGRILAQDMRVIQTHKPKQGGLKSGDKYIPADRPILLYYTHAEKLMAGAQAQEQGQKADFPAAKSA
jgi:phenylpropionate dioxygenase-like ring-hydroxylating dioxygenase large terminal subunit